MAAGVVREGREVLRDPCVEVTLGAEDELVIHGVAMRLHYLLPTRIIADIALKPDLR